MASVGVRGKPQPEYTGNIETEHVLPIPGRGRSDGGLTTLGW